MKLSDIKANPNNPRIIKDDKFKKLVKSIQDFPKMMELRPMVINADNIVLGGNMRLKALKELGYKEIPDTWVKRADELTEDEQRQFIIKDNVGFGEHDWEMLKTEWDVQELDEWGLDIPAFETEEVLEAKEDDFDVPEGGIKTDIVLGDLFEIGEHKLLCGSSTEIDSWSKLMGSELCDMVMTDPPYNVDYKGGNGLTIMNDKMENNTFYQFLYDFYTALGSYTNKASGVSTGIGLLALTSTGFVSPVSTVFVSAVFALVIGVGTLPPFFAATVS